MFWKISRIFSTFIPRDDPILALCGVFHWPPIPPGWDGWVPIPCATGKTTSIRYNIQLLGGNYHGEIAQSSIFGVAEKSIIWLMDWWIYSEIALNWIQFNWTYLLWIDVIWLDLIRGHWLFHIQEYNEWFSPDDSPQPTTHCSCARHAGVEKQIDLLGTCKSPVLKTEMNFQTFPKKEKC